MLSVGGGDGAVLACNSDSGFAAKLASGLVSYITKYGFDGVDFDIEHRTGDYVACARTIAAVVDALRIAVPGLAVTMAPQMTNVYPDYPSVSAGFNELAPLVNMTSFDWLQPQMYNTWSGVETVAYAKKYVSQLVAGFDVTAGAESFHVAVEPARIVLGYPASARGAGTGFLDPKLVVAMVRDLRRASVPVKGLMTWSIGWDRQNGYAFSNAVAASSNSTLR